MINICLQLNCDSSSKGKRNGKSQTERVQVISAFDLTVMWQQMDLKLSILSRRHLDCPSVFALLMFEVQLDVTMNHDLSEREGRCEVAGWKVMSVVEATEVSASYWHFTGAKYPLLCSATPCPRPCFVLEDFLFLDFQVFTANSSASAPTWPFDKYAGTVIVAVFDGCYQNHKDKSVVSSVWVESFDYADRETRRNGVWCLLSSALDAGMLRSNTGWVQHFNISTQINICVIWLIFQLNEQI